MTRSLHMEQHEFPDVDLILNGDPAEYLKKCGWKPWVRR